jgi:hypothetical protein
MSSWTRVQSRPTPENGGVVLVLVPDRELQLRDVAI